MTITRAFLPSLIAHFALGIALGLLVWSVGLGLLMALKRRTGAPATLADAVLAYPLGLITVLFASLLVLLFPFGWLAALAVVAGSLLALRGTGTLVRQVLDAVRQPALAVLPPAAAFGIVLGLFYHGPTSTIDSHAFGDVVYYVARLVSARESILDSHDLLAAGYSLSPLEGAPSMLGGALDRLLPVDPFFVDTTLLPTFMFVSVAIGLGLTLPRRTHVQSGPITVAVAAILTAVIIYPTWLAVTPPITLTIPLAFAVYRLARKPPPVPEFLFHAVVIGACILLTKVLAVLPVAVVLGWSLVSTYGSVLRRHAAAVLVVVLVPLAAAVLLLASSERRILEPLSPQFVPSHYPRAISTFLRTRSVTSIGLPLADFGGVMLVAALLVGRRWIFAAALAVGLLGSWTVAGATLAVSVGIPVFLAGLDFAVRPPGRMRERVLVGTAGIALALSVSFRDTAEMPTSTILTLLAGGALLAVLWRAELLPFRRIVAAAITILTAAGLALVGHPLAALAMAGAFTMLLFVRVPRRGALVYSALAGASILSLALVVHGSRTATLTLGRYDRTVLPHDYYQVWKRVSERVPRNALVFTTGTGESETGAGWNYYPGVAGRQVYLAGWTNSPLRTDKRALARRLSLNHALFLGRRAPRSISTARRYSSYYAVMLKIEPRPRSFTEIYSNRLYVLYRIPPDRASAMLVTRYACRSFDNCVTLPRLRTIEPQR